MDNAGPPPPPPPNKKAPTINLAQRPQQFVRFGPWFNSPILSDIKISISKTSHSGPVFNCHQIVLHLNSPTLLQAIKNNKVDNSNDNNTYYIVEELLDKPKETEIFLRSLYDPSILLEEPIATALKPIYNRYNVVRSSQGIPFDAKLFPTMNNETFLSDIRLIIKGTNNYFNCHRLFLVQSKSGCRFGILRSLLLYYETDSDYFKGIYTSNMVDNDSKLTEIHTSLLDPADISDNFNFLLESLYFGSLEKYSKEPHQLFVSLVLSELLITKNRDELIRRILGQINVQHCSQVIINALRYDYQEILQKASEFLFQNVVEVAARGIGFEHLPKEYFESLVNEADNTTIIQACLKSMSKQDYDCMTALSVILNKVGSDSPLTATFLDNDGNTALHLACTPAKPSTLDFLLKDKSILNQINLKNGRGRSAIQTCLDTIHVVIERLYGQMVPFDIDATVKCYSILLNHHAEVDMSDPIDGLNMLYTTCYLKESDPALNIALDLADKFNITTENYAGMLVKIALHNNNSRMLEYALIKRNFAIDVLAYPIDKILQSSSGRITMPITIKHIGDKIICDTEVLSLRGAKFGWESHPLFENPNYCAFVLVANDETGTSVRKEFEIHPHLLDLAKLVKFLVFYYNPEYRVIKEREEAREMNELDPDEKILEWKVDDGSTFRIICKNRTPQK